MRRDILIDHSTSLGILDAEIEFVIRGAPVDRRDHDAGELTAPMQRSGGLAILKYREDMVARLQADSVEGGHERRYPPVPLRVSQAKAVVDDRQRVRIARD